MSYERKNIAAMKGYTSGEQPNSSEVIKLNTNENPFPPSPAVEAALANLKGSDLRRYPSPTASHLREALGRFHQLETENIIVTNGGDELLRLVLSTFVELSESIGVAEPSYSLYPVLAKSHGCEYVSFNLKDDYNLPDDFAKSLNSKNIKMCFVVNPNAPSGHLTSCETLETLAKEFNGLLVIDEAYVDFIAPKLGYNAVPLVKKYDNVIILRTFSKGYSLAGLRMAYGIASKELISPMLYKTKDSFNTDFIAQTLALAALEDQTYVRETWTYVLKQRNILKDQLTELGFISVDSQSNFLLITIPEEYSAEAIYQHLKANNILVRYFNLPRLENKLRITIGTEKENTSLISALTSYINNSL